MTSERPSGERDEKEHERGRLERILPELIKRVVELGAGKIAEGPESVRHFVSELKLPKEVLALLLTQIDETKNGLYRAVAKELRDFLEQTNMAEELTKVLTTLSFEIKTEVRFIPNDARPNAPPKPDVRAKVQVKKQSRDSKERPSAEPPPAEPSVPDANVTTDQGEEEKPT